MSGCSPATPPCAGGLDGRGIIADHQVGRPGTPAGGLRPAGFSAGGTRRPARRSRRRRRETLRSTAKAASGVDGSSVTVGPEAIRSKGSPGTSEMISAASRPARHARARPPPLIRLSCLRTAFNSAMSAPAALRWRVSDSLSSRVMPSRGRQQRRTAAGDQAEAQVFGLARPRPGGGSLRAATPAGVGSLSPAGRAACSLIRRSGRTQSAGTLTQPASCFSSIRRGPSAVSTAAAMPAPALPAPTTRIRPMVPAAVAAGRRSVRSPRPGAFRPRVVRSQRQRRRPARCPTHRGGVGRESGHGSILTFPLSLWETTIGVVPVSEASCGVDHREKRPRG